jgi:hypothetical protein
MTPPPPVQALPLEQLEALLEFTGPADLEASRSIPLQELETCIPSSKAQHKQARAWFSKVELPTRSRSTRDHTLLLAVA